jgi:hypothetical protein
MLLRSLGAHLRSQNWTAVVLDFVIVVFGVFIGIQVANWNEEQAARATVERLLVRLESDFAGSRDYLISLNTATYEGMRALDALLTALENGEPLPVEVAKEGAERWTYGEFIPPPPASFEEMISTGRLDLIRAVSLRGALRHVAELTELTRVVNAQESGTLLEDLSPYLRFAREPRLSGNTPGTDDAVPRVQDIDQAALWEDLQARRALYGLYESRVVAQAWIQANLEAIDELLEQLQQHTPR